MKEKFLEAGKIVNTHAIKGEVKILPWADSAEFLCGFKTLYIDEKPIKILSARAHKGCVIAQFEGIENINDAMRLKNKTVCIDRADAKLPRGHFFISDLIGAAVLSEEGQSLGELTEVLDLPAGNVYVVKGEREILIPAVPEFIKNVDLESGLITVHLIEGM